MKKMFTAGFLFLFSYTSGFSQICTGIDTLGSASNLYTIGITESSAIAVDNDLNTVVFIHRNDAGAFGGHSGNLRYDISTDNGLNWTNNIGPVNPASVNGLNGARYPNVGIYNPAGNTNPNNAYLAYCAATTQSVSWSSHVTGVRKLDGTGNTEHYNQALLSSTYIPRSMCKGVPGTFWAMDVIYNGAVNLGYRILKGVWNNGTNDVIWSENTSLTPPFSTAYDGSNHMADFAIGFDPSGQKGWACMITHITQGTSSYTYYPVFYKTVNGGITWSGPTQVNIAQFSCVNSILTAGNVPTVAFDVDLTVDVLGNPHALVCIGSNPSSYSIYFTQAHHMFDITQENGLWNAIDLGDVPGQRNTLGIAPNTLSMDMEPQVSRTDDGTKVFFTWSGSDLFPLANAPNLFGSAYDVVNRKWTTMKDFSSCNPLTNGNILFPKMAENVLDVPGGWELPVIYGQLTVPNDVAAVSNFVYLDSLKFEPSEFTLPQCSANVTFANSDTVHICQGSSASLIVSSTQQALVWSTGTTSPILTVNTGGWYYATIRTGCCIGKDSIFVVVDTLPIAGFAGLVNNLNVSFSDQTTYSPTSWNWDFDDGNTSTLQNPNHSYDFPGTYTVCLIVDNGCSDTLCQTFTVSCTIPNANFTSLVGIGGSVDFTNTTAPVADSISWNFGDGNTSNINNPTHVYTSSGNYQVCLNIYDTCGTDSLCTSIFVDVFAYVEDILSGSFSVCPNPVDDILYVSGNHSVQGEWNMKLINGLGQIYWDKEIVINDIQEEIPTNNLAKGVYFLQMRSENQFVQYKVVKQ
ncbi:MAG: PKD domain-containing protein [Crocinitomicaceae bacterium]